MASLKLCLQVGARKQIRRSRVDSLADFTYAALQKIAAETFPDLPAGVEFGYEDDEGELVTLASDADVAECVDVMDVAGKKTLRIEIVTEDWKPTPKLALESGKARACSRASLRLSILVRSRFRAGPCGPAPFPDASRINHCHCDSVMTWRRRGAGPRVPLSGPPNPFLAVGLPRRG